MIIYNTTYQVDKETIDEFILWLKENYIPRAMIRGELSEPQLCKVITPDDYEGSSFSLQFHVKDTRILSLWYEKVGKILQEELVTCFGEKVVGFNTLLEIIA
ncbi:DUF4286 family protein [Coprobacter tertius]|uniref:DUF4286 family protein n=1 Tax=Coprobacter tertius TaxID=2944915 RepID=A0ABT1MEX3_9BACT|nr:DUF4286 family protein [Coprobacter tertius]MCP9611180.1 DUF4286 family protein [Coprobacter tertius]